MWLPTNGFASMMLPHKNALFYSSFHASKLSLDFRIQTSSASFIHPFSLLSLLDKHLFYCGNIPGIIVCGHTLQNRSPVLHPKEPLGPPEEKSYKQWLVFIVVKVYIYMVSRVSGRPSCHWRQVWQGRIQSPGNTGALTQMMEDENLK